MTCIKKQATESARSKKAGGLCFLSSVEEWLSVGETVFSIMFILVIEVLGTFSKWQKKKERYSRTKRCCTNGLLSVGCQLVIGWAATKFWPVCWVWWYNELRKIFDDERDLKTRAEEASGLLQKVFGRRVRLPYYLLVPELKTIGSFLKFTTPSLTLSQYLYRFWVTIASTGRSDFLSSL